MDEDPSGHDLMIYLLVLTRHGIPPGRPSQSHGLARIAADAPLPVSSPSQIDWPGMGTSYVLVNGAPVVDPSRSHWCRPLEQLYPPVPDERLPTCTAISSPCSLIDSQKTSSPVAPSANAGTDSRVAAPVERLM